MSTIANNLKIIQEELTKTSFTVKGTLIAVSKNFPVAKILEAYATGQLHFGENYPQELVKKAAHLNQIPIIWHFIGNIQKNKTKLIAEHATWIHTLTSKEHAKRLNDQRPITKGQLQVLIEVNISGESSKHGLRKFSEIIELAYEINKLPNLCLRGLMGMASDTPNHEIITQQFTTLANYLTKLQQAGFNLDQLSMGMSNDYQLAIAAGSTIVRIGSKIFGARK